MNNIRDIQDIREHLPNMPDPRKLARGVGGFIGVLLLVFLILTAAYTVKAESVGVVLRFGKYIKTVEPGLHFKIPFGVDRVYKVPVRQIRKQEFGYRTQEAGVRTQYEPGKRYEEEMLMLTGDLNIAEVQWAVQYRISDSYLYLFKNRNPEEALRDVSEAVMRSTVGDYTADEVLTQGRAEVSVKVHERMQEILDSYETGIQLVTVKLQDVHPPDPVKPSFNEVNEARQEQERMINNAWEMYNKEIPKAQGKAQQVIAEAEGYATDRVNRARGDAAKFLSIHEEYRKAPDVTRRRMYVETMSQILPHVEDIYVIDESQKGLVPLLQLLGREGQAK